MEIKSKFLCSRGVALAFAILLGGSPGVLLYANDSVEESLTVAQTGRTIKGLVTDVNGEPLIGCNVVVVGSNAGVITDIDGRFALNVPADAKQIKISYIGYVDQIITLHDRSDFKVVLKEDNNALDEVVVVGYGTQKKATLTGAVEQVSSKVLESRAITNVGAALQGATPGLVVTRSSSRPGNEGLNFQIRGATSVNGGKVLIIVDGVPTLNDASFQNLNPDDIESISVLKDGSASIYGAKAANGVIVITTKRGQTDRMTVNYNGTFSFRARPHYGLFNLMNSEERIQFSREAFAAGAVYQNVPVESLNTYEGIMTLFYAKQISKEEAEMAIQRLGQTNTDWFKLLTRNSFSHNHNLSISGGSEKIVYNASLGYSDQAGVEKDNDAKNLSGRINVGIELHPKVRVDMSLIGSVNRTWGYAAGVNPLEYATSTSRSVLAYDDVGNQYFQKMRANYRYNENLVLLGFNILNEMQHSYSKNKSSQINGNLNFSWDITPWLRYEFVGGINNNVGVSESYAGEQTHYVAKNYRGYDFGSEMFGSDKYKAAMLPSGGELYNGNSDVLGWNVQNKITFQKIEKWSQL